MTVIDRDRAAAAFKRYTDAYDAANPRIALKIEHTYHVAEACDTVAREQDWSTEDIDLAWLCGLLHDMGRFEQLRRWDTFKDAESMSHATLGIEVLFGENPADAPATTSIRDFIEIDAHDLTWTSVAIAPKEVRALQDVAPRMDAADMRFYVRRMRR